SSIVAGGSITGASATSQMTMGTNSLLEIDGALLATGMLDAGTNPGNTIEYNGTLAQSIKNPISSYYHLYISGTSTKTFPASPITILGDLEVFAGTLDVATQTITIGGNWINSSTIINLGTVIFNGTGNQAVTSGGIVFPTVTINKTSGTLILNEDVVVTLALTMTQGNINTGIYSLTLGSGAEGTFSYSAGRIIGKFGQYIGATTTVQFLYPIGTSTYDRTSKLTFPSTGGGRGAGIVYSQFVESNPGKAGLPLTDVVTLRNTFNEGYWDISASGFSKGASNTYQVELTGDGFISFSIVDSTRILTRTNAGSNWTVNGTHGTVSGNAISRSTVSTFPAQFAFADTTNCTAPTDPVIAGTTETCINNADIYSVTLNSGNSYNWTVVGGTIQEAGGGTTTGFTTDLNSITVDWASTGQTGSVAVVEKNSCTVSNTVTKSVNINSIAPTSITGTTLIAENSTGIAYSVTNVANTTYNWTITGGTQVSGGTTSSITVDWGSAGSGSVGVTATKTSPACAASAQTLKNVNIYVIVDSNGTGGGNWNNGASWATGTIPLSTESARILSGDVITLAGGGGNDINNLIVNGTLNVNTRTLRVDGDLTINSGGLVTGTSGILQLTSSLSSPQSQIEGTGSISGAFTIDITTASKTISPTAVISQLGTGTNFKIGAGLIVTNDGTISIGGNITGVSATSTWKNFTNSNLTVGGALLTTGLLNVSSSGNKVIYNTATAANIKAPVTSYYNLEIQTGAKTATTALDVNGNFTLTSGTFNLGTNNMNVAGNLTYTAGTLTTTGIISLDGTINQVVTGLWVIPNLTINNTLASGNSVTLANNITVSNNLTLTDGIVGTGTNLLTISNPAVAGLTGGSSASFINGTLARQTNSAALYDFPTGKTSYRRVGITPTTAVGSTYRVEAFESAY
ncbi:MAG: hypothetical protein OEY56_13485, partial [Cyclobacteriaceae bacterium]|nr:hypothetical protein [Cyclobacteriaceae bacterium]